MWHLLQAPPLQISPFGACLLWRPLYPRDCRLQCCRIQHHGLWHHRLLRWCHPSASHFHFQGVSQQPHTSRQCSHQVSLQDWGSPSIPPPTNLLPLVVRMLIAMGGRVLEAEMITAGLPVTPGECERGPPSGQPVSRHLARWVSTPLGASQCPPSFNT